MLAGWLTVEGREKRSRARVANGAEISDRISRNRAKRLLIAGRMKLESGVTGHEVNTENFAGLAFLGTGRIYSPEGSNMMQLYTVAHECGHIFLHDKAPGSRLPTHVMEMEAESYAHQAFLEHGMRLPDHFTMWGRSYVGSWIDKDRRQGIPIDSRALAYAQGTRSPYQALRKVPSTWHRHAAEGSWLPWLVRVGRAKLSRVLLSGRARLRADQPAPIRQRTLHLQRERGVAAEFRALMRLAIRQLIVGSVLSMVTITIVNAYVPLLELVDPTYKQYSWPALGAIVSGALLWTDLVVALRVAFGPAPRPTPPPPARSQAPVEPDLKPQVASSMSAFSS